MGLGQSVFGSSVRRVRVVVERGPVTAFADAVKSTSVVHRDATAAAEAGFDAIPAPPTFPFAAWQWGAFPELQDDGNQPDPMMDAIAELRKDGGMILHGEQEVTFERPLLVGDVLIAETKITDSYEKGTMTFVVIETAYRDDTTGEPVAQSRFTLIHRK